MSHRFINECDNCHKTYETPSGVSYDSKNYAGTNWVSINIEGFGAFLFCRDCSTPIREAALAAFGPIKIDFKGTKPEIKP